LPIRKTFGFPVPDAFFFIRLQRLNCLSHFIKKKMKKARSFFVRVSAALAKHTKIEKYLIAIIVTARNVLE